MPCWVQGLSKTNNSVYKTWHIVIALKNDKERFIT
jgi:hypothetical protein